MFALRRILIVLLLALSLPVQSYAAAVCAVVHTEPYGNATAEQGSMHHAVPPARVAAKSFDHLSSQCAAYCCIGLALPSEVALLPGPVDLRHSAPLAPAAAAPSFLTGGIDRPPRRTFA